MNIDPAKEAEYNIYAAQRLFLWSLGIGTTLEVAFIITDWMWLLGIGLLYLAGASLVNLIFFINNIIFTCIHREGRTRLLLNTFLMLLNIPIAILYAYLLFNH